jgi:hypothetical protein
MISSNPKLPALPIGTDTEIVSVGFMRKFYELFYREWRDLAGKLIDRGPFVSDKLFTTVWTATAGTATAIGNGTLTASYERRGRFCKFYLNLVGGSTTTWGNAGNWQFPHDLGHE